MTLKAYFVQQQQLWNKNVTSNTDSYSSTLSLTLVLDGVGGHCHALAPLPP
jgi:hypothetical protein